MVSVAHFILTVVLIAKFGCAQNLKEGDTCILEKSGNSGVCVSLKDCKSANIELRLRKRPQVCIHEGSISIVCCDTSQDGFVSPATSGAIPSLILGRTSRAAGSKKLICPDLPLGAVKVQKTGQKAWDKCIDIAESVNPCRPASFMDTRNGVRYQECGHSSKPLVVGGEMAAESEFPHMAAIGYGDPAYISWFCGGSLISKWWVLTAAHCLNGGERQSASFVRLGGGNLDVPPEEENLYTVNLHLKHPKYKKSSKYNDIGLIKLNKKVYYSMNVRPICLHTGEPVDDEKALVTGWGAIEERGQKSKNLMKATVEKFTFEECNQTYRVETPKLVHGVLNATQTCYGHRNESRDTCKGDSGGPLQIYNSGRVDCTYLLIGITSFGKVCGVPDIPAIYTRVSGFVPWIEENVWPDN